MSIKLKIFKYKNRELRINLRWRILSLRQKDTDPLSIKQDILKTHLNNINNNKKIKGIKIDRKKIY